MKEKKALSETPKEEVESWFKTENDLDFGDYVSIEQKRFGCDNEMYRHKVINRLKSNTYVDVPVQTPAREINHRDMAEVVSCICCGVVETVVLKYRVSDVAL